MKKSNSSSGDYDSTKAYFDIERDVRSTKFKVASIAAEDMSKTESLPVGAEAEKAPPIKPLKLLLILVAAVIVIALIQLIPSYVASRYPAFEYNEEYELPGRSRLASSLEKMAGWGVDTAIPATNGQELTFTVPSADKPLAYDTTYEFFTTGYSAERFQPGDEITTNFQNCDFGIGNGSYSGRYVVITSDGGKDTGY